MLNIVIGPLLVALVRGLATFPSEYTLDWCIGQRCMNSTISAGHLQLRLFGHYQNGGRPPLKQVHYISSLPEDFQKPLAREQPGLIATSIILASECLLYVNPQLSGYFYNKAVDYIHNISEYQEMSVFNAWPVKSAIERYLETSERLRALTVPQSVHLVVVHCAEDLTWLRELAPSLPPETRIFVYVKCDPSKTDHELPNDRIAHVPITRIVVEDTYDIGTNLPQRRDECSGYADHLMRTMEEGYNLPDYTIFLHGDPSEHWSGFTYRYFELIIKSMLLGNFVNVPFLHISGPRLVATKNYCHDMVYEKLFGRQSEELVMTYCCGQFIVSRERMIQARSVIPNLHKLVSGQTPDLCERVGPSYENYPGERLSYCYSIEFMWHIIFGEPDQLLLRSDDTRLPLFLRWKDNEEQLFKWSEQHFYGFSTATAALITEK